MPKSKIRIAQLVAFTAVTIFAGLALAQGLPGVPVLPSVVTDGEAKWMAIIAAGLLALDRYIDPNNTATPLNWSGPARAAAFVVVGGVAAALKLFPDGSSFEKDAVLAATTILGPMLLHFLPEILAGRNKVAPAVAKAAGAALLILGLGALASGTVACTKAQAANDVNVVQTALTDVEQACVDVQMFSALIANASPPAAADIAKACQFDAAATSLIESGISVWQSQSSAQGLGAKTGKKH